MYSKSASVKPRIQELYLYCSNHVDSSKKNYVQRKNVITIFICLIISNGCLSLGDALKDADTKDLIRNDSVPIRDNAFTNVNFKDLLNSHPAGVEKDKGAAMTMVLTSTYKHGRVTRSYRVDHSSTIGARAMIGHNTVISNSVIAADAVIGRNGLIADSVIAAHTIIRDNCVIRKSVINPYATLGSNVNTYDCVINPYVHMSAGSTCTHRVINN